MLPLFFIISDQATIQIRIVDVNDNEPKFDSNEYRVEIAEDAPVGSPVTTVTAVDLDKGRQKLFIFFLEEVRLFAVLVNVYYLFLSTGLSFAVDIFIFVKKNSELLNIVTIFGISIENASK